ncbi:Rop guanine nucleotide exchange factor 12 [Linum grandiflorum]
MHETMVVEQEKESLRSRLFNFRGLYDSSSSSSNSSSSGTTKHSKSLSLDDSSASSGFDDSPIIITSSSSTSTDDTKDRPPPLEKQKSRVAAAAAAIGRAISRNDKGSKSHMNRDQDVVAQLLKDKMHEMDQMKERFAKLLLGEDMSGGGKGVSSALALSNAITNLAASVFGEQWRLEPMSTERKTRWRREIDLLLSVTDHIVEFVASQQGNMEVVVVQIMVTRQRNDLLMNIPALRKLDAMLIDCLDNFKEQSEFTYVSRDAPDSEKGSKRKEEKWWLPTVKVPANGLSESARKFIQTQKDSVNQVLKAAMAINAQVLSEMEIPETYIESLPKNGRASLGDSVYRSITVESFDPDQFLNTMDLTSEHKILDLKDRIEASIVIWKRKMNQKDGKSAWGSAVSLEKRELFEERAETILIIMKQRFPGIPQSALDISKIESNRDVGQAILESYSRILESLAFTVLSRIEDVLYSDHCARNPTQAAAPKKSPMSQGETPTGEDEGSSPMTLLDFMGWDQNDNEGDDAAAANCTEDIQKEDAKLSDKLANVDTTTNKPTSYLASLVGSRSPTSRD